eukprot:scaffold6567_cov251-Prasinococcus_capsulatus_cf.AAC.3
MSGERGAAPAVAYGVAGGQHVQYADVSARPHACPIATHQHRRSSRSLRRIRTIEAHRASTRSNHCGGEARWRRGLTTAMAMALLLLLLRGGRRRRARRRWWRWCTASRSATAGPSAS